MQSQGVKKTLVIQGRPVGTAELEQVRGLLAAHHDGSRYRLSRELCRVWNWRSLTGQIKDMAARSLLLKLEERGLVVLPAPSAKLERQPRCNQGEDGVQRRTETLKPLNAAIDFLEPLNSLLTCSCPLAVKSHQGAGRWGIENLCCPRF